MVEEKCDFGDFVKSKKVSLINRRSLGENCIFVNFTFYRSPNSLFNLHIHTGQLLNTLEGHSANVTSVAFSPDGNRIVSGSYDSTVRVWDAASEDC